MMATSRKRKNYDTSYKLKAIERAEQSSKEAAAREFGVDAKRIRVWCSQKNLINVVASNDAFFLVNTTHARSSWFARVSLAICHDWK